jgi:CMP-2-keto-3-deoxyoctulosonic acid synthetase
MHSVVVIPARYASSRLPGKPLVDLCGKSLVQRTFERCAMGFPRERIYVATDDDRVQAHCLGLGINTLMTSPDCLTGTDRVAEVARTVKADLYINVQGDEPLFNPGDIAVILEAAQAHPSDILNSAARPFRKWLYGPTVASCTCRVRLSLPTKRLALSEPGDRSVSTRFLQPHCVTLVPPRKRRHWSR